MNEFVIIKAKNTLPSLKFMEKSYTDGTPEFFNITGSAVDRALVRGLSDSSYPIYILVFTEKAGLKSVEHIYLGTAIKYSSTKKLSLKVSVSQKMVNKSIIDNFLSCSEIDITRDFGHDSYITLEDSPSLVRQMSFIANSPYKMNGELQKQYSELRGESSLHPLAQRNQYCIRELSILSPSDRRGEFQRDYDRIIHCKAFRRMVDKAQIFSAEKGDYYRTRMTHSLVVNQIAKGISNALELNGFLTDAIALGHDIGHTPFGHQGERTLDAILTDDKHLLRDLMANGASYGGFKHNYHSLRVATRLEEMYIEFDGLDLSFQTLDGIWKHTKTNLKDDALADFVSSDKLRDFLTQNSSIPCTLEGQVVRIADEIAQRSHDMEDAFTAKRLTIEELKSYLRLSKMVELKNSIEKIEGLFEKAKNKNRFWADDDELFHGRISSKIMNFFIKDVLKQSAVNLKNYISADGIRNFADNGHRVSEVLIEFTEKGNKLSDYLEKIISKKVINSAEVSLFDSNGAAVIESLFNSYYKNPRLLHRGTLRRIMQDFRKVTKNVIDFEEGDPHIIEMEWNKIINAKADEADCDLADNEYLKKNRILVRNIVDFIAGMTDSYAIKEYRCLLR